MKNDLTVKEISTYSEFSEVRYLWESFEKTLNDSSIFLTFDWIDCCLSSFGENKEFLILMVFQKDRIIGIAPLWYTQDKIRKISIRKIEFIRSPENPFVDFLIEESKREQVLAEILQFLYQNKRDEWDVFSIQSLPETSDNYSCLLKVLAHSQRHFFWGYPILMPYIPVNESWDIFLNSKSSKFRKTRRNIINRINRLTNVELLNISNDKSGDVLEEILKVTRKSWKYNEEISIDSNQEVENFFKLLTSKAAQNGWLDIWMLKVDGITIAMEYDLNSQGKIYALRSDFDEAYKDYSPGAFLEYQIINHVFENNYVEYNTGPGIQNYKMQWTEMLKKHTTLIVCNNNYKSWIIWLLENKIIPFLRNIKNRIFRK